MKNFFIICGVIFLYIIILACTNSIEPEDGFDPNQVDLTNIITNQIGMDLKLIPAGNFTMGSSESWADFEGERPAHRVTISRAYYIGVTEVTQSQFQEVMGFNPSSIRGDNKPVVDITWQEAVTFCENLSELTGETYRLPTDAEWEYAARAGTDTRFFWGNSESAAEDYAWYSGNSNSTLHDVGLKHPNLWGLYDVAGNAEEFVSDFYNLMTSEEQTDPRGPVNDIWNAGRNHVLRSATFGSSIRFLHACWRHGHNGRHNDRGFRIIKEILE